MKILQVIKNIMKIYKINQINFYKNEYLKNIIKKYFQIKLINDILNKFI